ncbi:MAG TPA: transporter [Longimicrobium sp.]
MASPSAVRLHLPRFLLLLLATGATAAAQTPGPPAPIQDNSFLVEEAYNQERGVVQHINTFARAEGGGWEYAFTQEWPFRSQRHQLSYTIPTSGADGDVGLGDVALNYRYQAGPLDASTAFAPRLTLLLPTGSSREGRGTGGVGLQVNLPFSAELPASLVAHSNAGATLTPRAHDEAGNLAAALDYTLAQSIIWLARPKLNFMLEASWTRAQEVVGPGDTQTASELLVSPGVRGAVDLPSGLQIVPGLAFPIGVGPSSGERSVFLYLSFEHAFARRGP